MSSFTKKLIEIHFTLGQGAFGGKGNSKIVKGLDCRVEIQKPGLPAKNTLKATVTGMLLEDMEQLTTLSFKALGVEKNKIAVFAGDEKEGVSLVFAGDISNAFANFNAPDIQFQVEAMTGYYPSITPAPPKTYNGETDVGQILETLAKEMGYAFKNNGASVKLENPVLNGSPMEKAQMAAKAAGIDLLLDDETLICGPPGSGNGDTETNAVLLAKETGLIGYPSFNNQGLVLKSYYNAALKHGGLVRVESIVPKASGTWRITKLSHKLQNMGDTWQSDMETVYVAD